MATWGTEGDEASKPLPGDEQVPEPMLEATRAGDEILLERKTAVRVTHLNAPQAMVWALPDAEVELGLWRVECSTSPAERRVQAP